MDPHIEEGFLRMLASPDRLAETVSWYENEEEGVLYAFHPFLDYELPEWIEVSWFVEWR